MENKSNLKRNEKEIHILCFFSHLLVAEYLANYTKEINAP